MHPLCRRPNFGWICNLYRSHRILNCAASILHSRVILRAAIGCGLSLSLIQLPAEKENLKGTYFERVHEIITSILSNLFNLWNICIFPKRILRTASSSSNGDWKIWSHLIFLNLTPHSIKTKVTQLIDFRTDCRAALNHRHTWYLSILAQHCIIAKSMYWSEACTLQRQGTEVGACAAHSWASLGIRVLKWF